MKSQMKRGMQRLPKLKRRKMRYFDLSRFVRTLFRVNCDELSLNVWFKEEYQSCLRARCAFLRGKASSSEFTFKNSRKIFARWKPRSRKHGHLKKIERILIARVVLTTIASARLDTAFYKCIKFEAEWKIPWHAAHQSNVALKFQWIRRWLCIEKKDPPGRISFWRDLSAARASVTRLLVVYSRELIDSSRSLAPKKKAQSRRRFTQTDATEFHVRLGRMAGTCLSGRSRSRTIRESTFPGRSECVICIPTTHSASANSI